MTCKRTAVHETHDAVVDLLSPEQRDGEAYALVKLTYSVRDQACHEAPPEPLFYDMRRDDLEPRLRADSDFWPHKESTDFVVLGAALGGADVCQRQVSVRVGQAHKRLAVFGRRAVSWDSAGLPRIEPPEPFEQLPLTAEQAYGGIDWRVAAEHAEDPLVAYQLQSDHPGLYPRNPFGKGYLVQPGEVPKMELPGVEDPDDLLTAERLVLGDPRRWYQQPLPWHLDWMQLAAFPRNVLFATGVEPWFEGPDDHTLAEVARGQLPPGYRELMRQRPPDQGPHPRFFQGGSHGLVLQGLGEGAPVELRGFFPYDHQTFVLPPPPRLRLAVDGDWQAVRPRLHHVVCEPARSRVVLVYGASRPLPRPFVPGVHKKIPVALSVDGHEPLEYQTPPTVKELLARGQAEQQKEPG